MYKLSIVKLECRKRNKFNYIPYRDVWCKVTSDVVRQGTRLPRLLDLIAAMFILSNTRCYQAEATWQPRMLTDWVARERAADDNLGALNSLTSVLFFHTYSRLITRASFYVTPVMMMEIIIAYLRRRSTVVFEIITFKLS